MLDKKIIVLKDGPYKVCGSIPLYGGTIVKDGDVYFLQTEQRIHTPETYFLCRCGGSKRKPFCDGSHLSSFDGTEVPPKQSYEERAKSYSCGNLTLLDDDRCVLARFCHRNGGLVWDLAKTSGINPLAREEAIIGASACPSGRLTIQFEDGTLAENQYQPAIFVINDPEKGVYAGLFVRGNIPLEREDGEQYELRNRYALCRCGHSRRKPFCDMRHIKMEFRE